MPWNRTPTSRRPSRDHHRGSTPAVRRNNRATSGICRQNWNRQGLHRNCRHITSFRRHRGRPPRGELGPRPSLPWNLAGGIHRPFPGGSRPSRVMVGRPRDSRPCRTCLPGAGCVLRGRPRSSPPSRGRAPRRALGRLSSSRSTCRRAHQRRHLGRGPSLLRKSRGSHACLPPPPDLQRSVDRLDPLRGRGGRHHPFCVGGGLCERSSRLLSGAVARRSTVPPSRRQTSLVPRGGRYGLQLSRNPRARRPAALC